jgi:hypothetical protein
MKPIQAVCDKCQKTVEAKPLLSENELWLALNKGDEIEVMHLADDVHHTWKLTGQDKRVCAKREPREQPNTRGPRARQPQASRLI